MTKPPTTFVGVRDSDGCSVGQYLSADADLTVSLGAGGAVNAGTGVVTLNSSFVDDDWVCLFPEGSSLLPWPTGTFYRLNLITSTTFLICDAFGLTIAPVEATTGNLGKGRMRVQKVTPLVNSRSVEYGEEYEWSYNGFNPLQLAWDLLAECLAITQSSQTANKRQVWVQQAYEDFSKFFIAKFPHDRWSLGSDAIEAWLEQNIAIACDWTVSSNRGVIAQTTPTVVAATVFTFYPLVSGYNLTYVWDFGDGGSSTSVSPTHTYTINNDRFTVSLSVQNAADFSTRSRTEYITIGTPPDDFINLG